MKIPNSVIEKNKKAWDSFIIGQFYEEPPPRGAVHAIVNGIWSRQRRDISVSKMDGHAFLFRVPCPISRRRILSQSLWQVDGQTMFVAKWSPGVHQKKPELSMVPVWLEFTGVPLQFFNREGLQEIAGLVGHPVCLHPATENLTNIEVAKVYTVIDPRKPLPEGVNAQFESGEIRRIKVSSPWLPSLCSFCKKVGHTISRCSAAPPTCVACNSVKHTSANCPRARKEKEQGKTPIKSLLPLVPQTRPVNRQINGAPSNPIHSSKVYRAIKDTNPMLPVSPSVAVPDKNSNATTAGTASSNVESIKDKLPSQPPSAIYTIDLSKGELCVDLTPKSAIPSRHDSDSPSDPGSSADDEDNPNEGNDKFIQVFSKRLQKQIKSRPRAGGPSIL